MSTAQQPSQRLAVPLDAELRRLQGSDWWPVLERWRQSAAGQDLVAAVDARVAAGAVVYPPNVFRALELTPLAGVRVVILGQDPYHGAGQAEGLAFSVPDGQTRPPSLRNIFKELQRDLDMPPPGPGANSLRHWAQQGVLLLNSSLTVEDGLAGSHARLGWHVLTDEIVQLLRELERGLVFMLWGTHAQARWAAEQAREAGGGRHLVLRSNHPSPLSALRPPQPFIGCGHFGQANRWLQQHAQPPIVWQVAHPPAHAILAGSPEGCPSG